MWSLELIRTVDGRRLGSLPLVDFSWERTVRDGRMAEPPQGAGQQSLSSFSFSLAALEQAGWIDRSEPHWQDRLLSTMMPVRNGIAAFWDGQPIVAGPLSPQVKLTNAGVSFTVDGPTSLLAGRYVVPDEFAADRQIAFRGLDLGSIAAEVVKVGMEKPGGHLPVTFDPPRAGTRERTYQAFNVSNLDVAGVLEKIANVQGGPDIDFRPYLVDDQHLAWHLHTGTETDPWIGQTAIHSWEVGSPDVKALDATYSAEYVAHRVYGVGGGQDVATTTVRVDMDVPEGWPLIERVVSDSGIEEGQAHLLRRNAEAVLLDRPIVQVSLEVRADGSTPLGTFWPGELADVSVQGHPALRDGTHRLRILSMKGSVGKTVTLKFDPLEVDAW